jgi:hypothetical protein
MAIQKDTKINYPFKKINDKTHSTNLKEFYEESRWSALGITDPKLIWVSPISSNPTNAVAEGIALCIEEELVEDITVGNRQSYHRETNDPILIPPTYGRDYIIELLDGSGTPIPSGHDVGWFFDYVGGTLAFEQAPENYGLYPPFKIIGYGYVGKKLSDILGGLTQTGVLGAQVCCDGKLIVSFSDPYNLIDSADVYRYIEESGEYLQILDDFPIR